MKAIDLFAGAGGSSEGARMAGFEVVWAANHWKLAVSTHEANHPGTEHACQDLQQANWFEVPEHDILIASPACQGHSKAKGKEQPHHDETRSTAWAVVSCLEVHRTPFFVVENVKEFNKWILYPQWLSALEALGYSIDIHLVDAADHGVPQNRLRLFIVGALGNDRLDLKLPKRKHVPASNVIDFNDGRWSKLRDKVIATRRRARAGRAEHGERFVMPYYGTGSGETGRAIDRPIGTLTTRARWAVVNGSKLRMLTVREEKLLMGFDQNYELQGNRNEKTFLMGNAVCPPVMRDILTEIKRAA